MRKGFTIIELLVIMVVLSLLVGLLLPAMARLKEEERKITCESNLAQIGVAIQMYASGNDGWTPEMGGNRNFLAADGKFGEPPSDPDTIFGTMFTNCGIMSINATVGQPQAWLATPEAPARPVGLGLLWAGGYLSKAGAQTLYCPSNESSEAARKKQKDLLQRYDADEPFWTSAGKVVRANGNGLGDNGTTGGGFQQDESPKAYWHYVGCGSEAMGQPGYVKTRFCQVWLNYSYRMLKKHMSYKGASIAMPTAIKLKEAGNIGLVTDTLEMERSNWRPWGKFKRNVGVERISDEEVQGDDYIEMAREVIITNHDMAYNVLFADGSVKTYDDFKENLFTAFCVIWNHKPNDNWRYTHLLYNAKGTTDDDLLIWTPFLDGAYSVE